MQRVKELREKSGLTQKMLGDIIGVAESTISLYERGKRQPSQEILVKLASYFHVTIDYLLGREEAAPIAEEKPAANGSELDEELINLMLDLPDKDFQRVKDFVAGLKAAREDSPSPRS